MRHNTSGIFTHMAPNLIKSILNSSVLLLPFIVLTERRTECQYCWQVMVVFCEMENIVGSSSQNMFSPWSQSWLHLPLSFKGKTPLKQLCVFCSCCQEPLSLLLPTVLFPYSQRPSYAIHYLTSTHPAPH